MKTDSPDFVPPDPLPVASRTKNSASPAKWALESDLKKTLDSFLRPGTPLTASKLNDSEQKSVQPMFGPNYQFSKVPPSDISIDVNKLPLKKEQFGTQSTRGKEDIFNAWN